MSDPIQGRTVGLLSAAATFAMVGTAALVTTGPVIAAELGGSAIWGGSAGTTMSIGSTVAAALLARLAVVRGRRPALTTGVLVALLGCALVILAVEVDSIWVMLAGCALGGFASSANLQARFAATDLAEPQHRGRDLSIVLWLGTIGIVVGPNLVGVGDALAASLGLQLFSGLYVIAVGSLLISLLIIVIGIRPDPLLRARVLGGTTQLARHGGLLAGLRAIWASRPARAGLIGVLIGHGLMVGVMSMTPVHLAAHGASIVLVGVVVSFHNLGMYVLSPLWGSLTDRLGGPRVIVVGFVILVVGGLLCGIGAADHLLVGIGITLVGLGWGAATIAGAVVVTASVADADRVAAQGAADTGMNLAGALCSLLAGVALAGIAYLGLGIAAAVIAAAGIAFVVMNARRAPRAEVAETTP
ncbi:MAG TPA: MFS transporter [Microbacteriaceae bacterium]|nr:MFS transporter [Microbacteriaceae bacterium]